MNNYPHQSSQPLCVTCYATLHCTKNKATIDNSSRKQVALSRSVVQFTHHMWSASVSEYHQKTTSCCASNESWMDLQKQTKSKFAYHKKNVKRHKIFNKLKLRFVFMLRSSLCGCWDQSRCKRASRRPLAIWDSLWIFELFQTFVCLSPTQREVSD